MFENKVSKINKSSGLKKRVIRSAIIVRLDIDYDFPLRRLMQNSKFKQISEGDLNLEIDNVVLHIGVNEELIEVVKNLISENVLKINNLGWLIPGRKFEKRYPNEILNDFAYDFVVIDGE